ncbi:MAG TPA: sel1 repeat family protein [Arenimonas sp.]|nr:sel1 repeat family protein [Arenimonas sp.]
MRFKALACLCLLAAAWTLPAAAQTAEDADERRIMSSAAFLSGHPDLRYRLAGLKHYRKNDFDAALVRFRRAARYGDKPSQAMVGEMYWTGQGVAQDKVLGYVWMDLAAERLYPLMLAKRERYWSELDEAQRARVLEIGQQVYAEYGDDVAKERLDRELRFAKRNTTGSRVGSVGALTIVIPTPGGTEVIDGSKFYDEKFWNVDQYLEWQDADWINNAEGTVDVGEVMSAGTPLPEESGDEE